MKISLTDRLVDRFIKDADNTGDMRIREKYGRLSSICGMICNTLLFVIKLTAGLITASIAVISDAFNNLADCASCFITLLGCRIAAKPADKEHPFGHGRMEYLTALGIAAVIVAMGLQLLRQSLVKVIHPESVRLSLLPFVILLVSIAVKLWMYCFNDRLSRRINSVVLKAVAKDSVGDVAATTATALSLLLTKLTPLPFDGIAGGIVSLLIILSGIEMIRDTVDELLGKSADPETLVKLRELICRSSRVIGVHDIMLHSYGPANTIGSCHVEMSADENFKDAHELVDEIEREIYAQLGISMTIHMDPAGTEE